MSLAEMTRNWQKRQAIGQQINNAFWSSILLHPKPGAPVCKTLDEFEAYLRSFTAADLSKAMVYFAVFGGRGRKESMVQALSKHMMSPATGHNKPFTV